MDSNNEESSVSTESSGSTESIDFSVRSTYEFRASATQTHVDSDTLFTSTDFASSGNSEITNSNDPMVDPLGGNVSPLMFQSQYSNTDSQTQGLNMCRQIFSTESLNESFTPEASTSAIINTIPSSDTSSEIINPPNTPEPSTSATINTNTSDSGETTASPPESDSSDYPLNTETLSATESETSVSPIKTQRMSQYVKGDDTQYESQEMYPSTMSQSSEGLQRSDRRTTVQIYDNLSNSSSSSNDPDYNPAVEIPQLTRQNAIYIPSCSRKRNLELTDDENEDIQPKKIKKK